MDPRSITTELTFPNPYRSPGSATLASTAARLGERDRIGGLLLLFVGLQFTSVALGVYEWIEGAGAAAWAHQRGLTYLAETLRAERVLLPVSNLALVVGLVAIFGRFRWTPTFWQVYFASTAFLSVYFSYALWHAAEPIHDLQLATGLKTAAAQHVGAILGSVLWLFYWARSRRVSARFSLH